MNSPAASPGEAELFASLRRLITASRPTADTRLIADAYEVAAYWHQGRRRRSGDPYITHPVAVAAILAGTGADDPMLCAALLHAVVEDTPYTLAALRGRFGAEVAGLVAGVTAMDKLTADQAASDRAAAVALAGDERVLLIKLADRLHNARTLRYLPAAKQVRKSRQTLEVMVPLARALRMEAVSAELEELASATLRRHGRRPGAASGRLLAASAALLPASARARWRQEWLAELHTFATRRERVVFAVQVMVGIGRLAVTLYQPTNAFKRACGTILATAATAGAFAMGGWKAMTALAAVVLAVLGTVSWTVSWILRSDDRTGRLVKLIRAFRDTPRE